jgi:hypothetical protein
MTDIIITHDEAIARLVAEAALASQLFLPMAVIGQEWMGDDAWLRGDDDDVGRRARINRRPPVPSLPSQLVNTGKKIAAGVNRINTAAGVAAGTVFNLTGRPQRAFQPERLFVQATVQTAAGAVVDALTRITIGRISVGDRPQVPTVGDEVLPGVMFREDSWGSYVDFSTCIANGTIAIPATMEAAVNVGDTFILSAGLIGRAIGE